MTREEQIIEQAGKASKIFYKVNDNHRNCFHYGFIDGVKWADKHPNPNTIKKIFEFALEKTNFLIADNLESIDWEVLIKKAMKE